MNSLVAMLWSMVAGLWAFASFYDGNWGMGIGQVLLILVLIAEIFENIDSKKKKGGAK